MAFVLNVSSNLWSGFGFLFLDFILVGLVCELTKRLASQINRRQLLREEPVRCKDIGLPLVGGGLATRYGWIFATIRAAAMLCVLAFEFAGEGQTRPDIARQTFEFRFGEAGLTGESVVDEHTLNLLPAYQGQCSTPIGPTMQLFEGVMFADKYGRGQLDTLVCLNGVDSPTERFLLEYDLIQKDLSLAPSNKEDGLFGWQPKPGASRARVSFERRLTALGEKDREFRGGGLLSYCMDSVSRGIGACLVLLEADDAEKFLFPQIVNRSKEGMLMEDWNMLHGLAFRGNVSHGVARAAKQFMRKYKRNVGLDLHDSDLAIDLLKEMVSVRKINESELVYTGDTSNVTEIKPFGVVVAIVLIITVIGLFAAVVYLRESDELNGVASYNELAELVKRYGIHNGEESKVSSLLVLLRRNENSESANDDDLVFAVKTV